MNRLLKALLIFNLQLLLLVPSCVQQKTDRGLKTGDQYWAETGLGTSELESLILDDSCHSSQQMFLACVNAVSQIAEKYNLVITTSGDLKKIEVADIADRLTEKKELSKWTPVFKESGTKISFFNIWKKIEKEFVKETERSSAAALGINGFLSVYKDPHTYIMPLAMYEEVIASSESRNANIGLISKRLGNELIVRKVFSGSAADLAGARKGDRIVSINNRKISELLPSQVSEMFKMRSSGRLQLSVVRHNGEEKTIEVFKSEKVYPSVVSSFLQGSQGIGLVTIHKFAKNVCENTREQIISLKEQGMRGLLLDLRDNPGGQVEEAACVINLFVEKGTLLFETRYLDISKPSDQYFAEKEALFKGPLAVLINSGSASASEIVAGSLKDLDRARLVGERSFGKGSFQDGKIWGPNQKIALFGTEGLYYFPSGWTPQLVGLNPDITVSFNDSGDQREEELYLNPITPVDSWLGPQNLAWLMNNNSQCESQISGSLMGLAGSENDLTAEDPQVQKAQAWLTCGENNDRNGSL